MTYADTAITTPREDPVQYDANWRAALASAVVTYNAAGARPKMARDPWVQRQMRYLRLVNRDSSIPDNLYDVQLASRWYQSNDEASVKCRLEPLLLTAVPFDVIALDIGGGDVPVEAFKAYERLYFNVRKDDGTMHPSCFLRTHFSLPTGLVTPDTPDAVIWKVIAANSGYEALMSAWRWRGAHGTLDSDGDYMLKETWRAAQAHIHHEIVGKRVNHLNMSMLMDRITAHEKMRHETSQAENADETLIKTTLNLLAHTRPHMVSSSKTVDENIKLTQALQSKLMADRQLPESKQENKDN